MIVGRLFTLGSFKLRPPKLIPRAFRKAVMSNFAAFSRSVSSSISIIFSESLTASYAFGIPNADASASVMSSTDILALLRILSTFSST